MDGDDIVIVALCDRDRGMGPAFSRHMQVCPTFRYVGAILCMCITNVTNLLSFREAVHPFS